MRHRDQMQGDICRRVCSAVLIQSPDRSTPSVSRFAQVVAGATAPGETYTPIEVRTKAATRREAVERRRGLSGSEARGVACSTLAFLRLLDRSQPRRAPCRGAPRLLSRTSGSVPKRHNRMARDWTSIPARPPRARTGWAGQSGPVARGRQARRVDPIEGHFHRRPSRPTGEITPLAPSLPPPARRGLGRLARCRLRSRCMAS